MGTYELTLPLNEGGNTITFADGNWYAPDIDRIIVEPLAHTGPENPGQEDDNLGTLVSSHSYGAITAGTVRPSREGYPGRSGPGDP
ncbi:hypothetical protein PBOR_09620 [Paenibacillus borealis]|uniref:Uncharacterized protein n=1 Tax=Paenibacillus borealis TaxID=160799 RepID=A0A089L6Q0_PAEBO|nr:hypothetical protein PBOR_09620 [Paenibacillus borealis]